MKMGKTVRVLQVWSLVLLVNCLGTIILDITPHTALAASELPSASRLENMPTYPQQRRLSCEYAATRIALARWGIQMSETDFINAIPVNDNPHLGFRGDINAGWGGTYNYGIYPEPIARFLVTKDFNTKLLWNGVDQLKEEVALGRPVVVWISGGLMYGSPFEAQAEGQSFWLMPFEHTVTVYGYDERGIYVADPGYGTYNFYNWADFIRSWNYLGNMAMSVYPAQTASSPAETPGIAPEFYRYWLRNKGLELSGQPVAAARNEANKTIQYFERTRLEYDNNLASTQNISRGLLGLELTGQRLKETNFQPLGEAEIVALSRDELNRFFPQTGFTLGAAFAAQWWERGGVVMFGYPISKSFYENGLLVQYFERARMEVHVSPNQVAFVLLGLLGNEKLALSWQNSQLFKSEAKSNFISD